MEQRGWWRGRSRLSRITLVGLAVVLLAVVAVALALVTDVRDAEDVRELLREPAPELPEPALVLTPAAATAPKPVPEALARVLEPLATAPEIGSLGGQVVDDETGEVLWSREADKPRIPASSTKLLTATAALIALDADATQDTVVGPAAGDPETLVVVPGGDLTMTVYGNSPFFPGAATLTDLANQVKTSDVSPKRIVVSSGLYNGLPLGPEWSDADIEGGNITPVEPWMLNAGRVNPIENYSPRSSSPMRDSAERLAELLGLPKDSASIAFGKVDIDREVGRVSGAPLIERIRSMLEYSDNILSESVCREIVLDREPGGPANFGNGSTAVVDVLRDAGIPVEGTVLGDCSGMSRVNRISPETLTAVLRLASAPDAPRDLRVVLDSLPIAAGTGTLEERFTGRAAPGAGWVRAKTGTLTGVNALAGTVTTREGRAMSFAFLSEGPPPGASRPALDNLAAALRDCGCR